MPLPAPDLVARQFCERLLGRPEPGWTVGRFHDALLEQAVAALLAEQRRQAAEAMRERCIADVQARAKRREDCPPGCLCADAAHLVAGLRALPLD